MKKIKKFIKNKGGIKLIIATLLLILLASFFIVLGVVYTTYGGDWNKIPELLSSDFAIAVYIIIALTLFFLGYILIMDSRHKEIK